MDGSTADRPAGPGEGEGEGGTPLLALEGFTGPLERLLALARGRRIDLGGISPGALADQLAAALRHAAPATSLGRKGDWLVMASWLLQLRSRLLLPAGTPARRAADREADRLHRRLSALREVQALALWLERRPHLSEDVFARGRPEISGIPAGPDIDVVEFLWASMALFDVPSFDTPPDAPETQDAIAAPRPRWLHSVAEARARILHRLGTAPEGQCLDRLLPEPAGPAEAERRSGLRRRLAWASTFAASLELARQGAVALAQENCFSPIRVSPVPNNAFAPREAGAAIRQKPDLQSLA